MSDEILQPRPWWWRWGSQQSVQNRNKSIIELDRILFEQDSPEILEKLALQLGKIPEGSEAQSITAEYVINLGEVITFEQLLAILGYWSKQLKNNWMSGIKLDGRIKN